MTLSFLSRPPRMDNRKEPDGLPLRGPLKRARQLADKIALGHSFPEANQQLPFSKHFRTESTPEKVHVIYQPLRFVNSGFNAAPKRPRDREFFRHRKQPFFLSYQLENPLSPRKESDLSLPGRLPSISATGGGEATSLLLYWPGQEKRNA